LSIDISGLIFSAISLMTPVLLAGIAELFVERSGILNLGVEGAMLIGAFAAFMGAYYYGDLGFASLIAALSGIAFCTLFAILTVSLALNQMVTGLAMNLLAIGITSYLYRASFGWYVSPIPPHIKETLKPLDLGALSEMSIVGKLIFGHLPHTYFAIILAIFGWWLLSKTDIGLKIRAMGEDPQVADSLGINVNLTRYALLLAEGAIAGLAGSLLSIGYYNMFLDNMTQGRGYIAIALVILARWNPVLLIAASFLFSMVDALQLRIQALGLTYIPPQLALMLPYLFTIIVLLALGRKVRGPAALARSYKRQR